MGFLDFFRPKPQILSLSEANYSPKQISANRVSKIGANYVKNATTKDNFEAATSAINVDFDKITNAYITDSYIRQSVDKHVDFVFKAGYDITGKNQQAVDYVKARIAALEFAISESFESFLRRVAEDCIKYHNAFIVKVRQPGGYVFPNKVKATGVYSNKPVVAYYLMPVSSVTIARDYTGTPTKYRQQITGVQIKGKAYIDINPEDMVHIAIDRLTGRAYGIPYLWEALDDVKILRHLEQMTDQMLYKNIFPLVVYTVGLDKPGMQSTNEEIEDVRATLGSDFTFDGGLVVPERHKIEVISTGAKALDVAPYLDYFKNRSFVSLGVSPTIMGEGDSASRSTADTLDQGFKDRIKSYQKEIELAANEQIIKELLLEGGFDIITDPTQMVYLRFKEIDMSTRIASENHVTQLFTQNAITHDELRRSLGLEPLSDQELERTYSRLVTAWLDAERSAEAASAANNAGSTKDQPQNQNGTALSPKAMKENLQVEEYSVHSRISRTYTALKQDVVAAVYEDIKKANLTSYAEYDKIGLEMAMHLASRSINTVLENAVAASYMQAFSDNRQRVPVKKRPNATRAIRELQTPVIDTMNIFMQTLQGKLLDAIHGATEETLRAGLERVFDSLEHRLAVIYGTETMRAHNAAIRDLAVALKHDKVVVQSDHGCSLCQATEQSVSAEIPPYHSNCKCRLVLLPEDSNA